MPIIYIISTLALFTLTILLKKTEKKLEIIKSITITLVLMLSYNTLVCYILNLVNIPITLACLSIINIIISIILGIKIIKSKNIQKYTINKINIIVVLLFISIVTIVMNINFGNLTKIRYISMDAREHYKAAREFSENESLSNKAVTNNTTTGQLMPGAYTNVGIIFKVLQPYVGTINLYKAFIIFEAFIYLLVGLMFYILLEKYCNTINKKIIAITFSVLYILGYPLSAWISGFHYLILGILYIQTIIYTIMEKPKIEFDYELLMLFLLNLGLILSYSLFCPFVYLAEFIYYIQKYKKEKSKIKLFLSILVTLILPGIIGVTYLIIPSIGKVGGFIALEGWVYKNLWSNFILFIPFTIYYIYKNIKQKKLTFDNIILITLLTYMTILFIGTKVEKCSEYYFYKNYFILWLMLIYTSTQGMLQILNEKKAKHIANIYTVVYLVILVTQVCNYSKYVMVKADDNLNEIMEIYKFNKTMICAKNAEFITKEEIQLYKETEKIIKDKWKEQKEILFVTDPTQERWIQSLTGYINILFDNVEYAIQNLQQENYKYIVTFENKETYKGLEKYINKENMEKIYEIESGKIYERKN